jgi:hypothetical protein
MAAQINPTVVTPDAEVLMMRIRLVTLAKRAVSVGFLSCLGQQGCMGLCKVDYFIEKLF